MFKKIEFKIQEIRSENDKALIETEIDVLGGVKNIDVNHRTGETIVEFDNSKISENQLFKAIEDLGFSIEKGEEARPAIGEHVYFVKGMHCASCEILIEKRLVKFLGIKSVEASADKGRVLIEYEKTKPTTKELNEIFKKENYLFSDAPTVEDKNSDENGLSTIITTALLLIVGFFILKKLGLTSLINVNSKSSLIAFVGLGLMAGISSCAALVGGLVLSMSKQWLELYSKAHSFKEKLQPHIMFNVGRIVSYAVLGAILGALGNKLQISLSFTSLLIFAVSIIMVFLALQMLGLKAFRRFQFTMPKFATRYVADERNFKGRYMPFLMGALTFFLPCGFTVTAQGLALLSGNPVQGGLIMFSFALGTLPMLLGIGISSVKLSQKPHLSYKFLKIAGVLVLFFALYNINSQLNVLGFPSFSDISIRSRSSNVNIEEGLAPIVNGKQILKMDASAYGYSPNYFKVKTGIPVRWEITDKGTGGCTNAIISKSLFPGEIDLTPGQVSVKEFTPTKSGKYKFSCWMGMISGIIEVVDGKKSINSVSVATANSNSDNDVIPSGAKSCGCGGGSGSCGIR
jgi:sulfite exporter TauE/SafE/copper chaperone CopZ/plastocyanin